MSFRGCITALGQVLPAPTGYSAKPITYVPE